jgi:Flp pilus assembly protein TadG
MGMRDFRSVTKTGRQGERGTAIVEAAFTLLPLFIFLFAIMEAGRFFEVQQTLTDAAREGARLGVAPLTQTDTLATKQEIVDKVTIYLNAASIQPKRILVDGENSPAPPANFRKVRVEADYSLITLSMFSSLQFTLKGEALMRNETTP